MQALRDECEGFTVCCLLYGDHLPLARRCLGSIIRTLDPDLVRGVRVGMNACSEQTSAYVYASLKDLASTTTAELLTYDSPVNRLKYPLMRKMFHDPAHPLATAFTMWFDDDSCITDGRRWWREVHARMHDSDMIGSVYGMPWRGNQRLGIEMQPWFNGVPILGDARFATGGWWCARTEILQRWDYPFPEITHNGGDMVLGDMLRQQGLRLNHFRDGVWINADEAGRESGAPRRGEIRDLVWQDYDPDEPPDLTPHDFDLPATDVRA